jgi:hypothetical protein
MPSEFSKFFTPEEYAKLKGTPDYFKLYMRYKSTGSIELQSSQLKPKTYNTAFANSLSQEDREYLLSEKNLYNRYYYHWKKGQMKTVEEYKAFLEKKEEKKKKSQEKNKKSFDYRLNIPGWDNLSENEKKKFYKVNHALNSLTDENKILLKQITQ